MSNIKIKLFKLAKETYGNITRCASCATWGECFTEENGHTLFWFNDEDKSTHLFSSEMIRG